jgi:hypothetical protein
MDIMVNLIFGVVVKHIFMNILMEKIYTNKELCKVIISEVFEICQCGFLTMKHTIKEIEKNLILNNIKYQNEQ